MPFGIVGKGLAGDRQSAVRRCRRKPR